MKTKAYQGSLMLFDLLGGHFLNEKLLTVFLGLLFVGRSFWEGDFASEEINFYT